MSTFNETTTGGGSISGIARLNEPTIHYSTPQQIDISSFILGWRGELCGVIEYRIYQDGVQVASVSSTNQTGEILLHVAPDSSPFVEVIEKEGHLPAYAFPNHIALNWEWVTGASRYLVQQSVNSVWLTRQTVTDNGEGVFLFTTPALADGETHSFRIVPVNSSMNEGEPMTFEIGMVRIPNAPTVSYSYDAVSQAVIIS